MSERSFELFLKTKKGHGVKQTRAFEADKVSEAKTPASSASLRTFVSFCLLSVDCQGRVLSPNL